MNDQDFNFQNNKNKTRGLTSIFSIIFVSLFFVTIALSQEKETVSDKSMTSVSLLTSESIITPINVANQQTMAIQINHGLKSSEIIEPTGTSSSISNYVNAWKLSKVTPPYQVIA